MPEGGVVAGADHRRTGAVNKAVEVVAHAAHVAKVGAHGLMVVIRGCCPVVHRRRRAITLHILASCAENLLAVIWYITVLLRASPARRPVLRTASRVPELIGFKEFWRCWQTYYAAGNTSPSKDDDVTLMVGGYPRCTASSTA